MDSLYFPTGLALDDAGERLYVANSDFDLQFNAGTLFALNVGPTGTGALLPRYCDSDADCAGGLACDVLPPGPPVNPATPAPSHWCVTPSLVGTGNPCPTWGLQEKSVSEAALAPGRCSALALGGWLTGAASTSAFATDVVYRARPAGSSGSTGRIFVPVRGDLTLTWADVTASGRADQELDCGQSPAVGGGCDDAHRVGDATVESVRDQTLPAEPFGIAIADAVGAGAAAYDPIVLTHQGEGQLSLFTNSWAGGGGPRLEFLMGGLPLGTVDIVSIPEPKVVRDDPANPQRAFLVTFRDAAELRLVRFYADGYNLPPSESGEPEPESGSSRPFLSSVGSVPILSNSLGFDSRGVAVDAAARAACEAGCAAVDTACLMSCAAVPLGVYVANRTPATLLTAETRVNATLNASDDLPYIYDSTPLSAGPSRVVVGEVQVRAPSPGDTGRELRVFVICFDSRLVYVYDPAMQRVESVIRTGRGPYSLAISVAGGTALGYLGHFTDSWIGVVDLDQRHPATYGTVVMTLGQPTPPRDSQ